MFRALSRRFLPGTNSRIRRWVPPDAATVGDMRKRTLAFATAASMAAAPVVGPLPAFAAEAAPAPEPAGAAGGASESGSGGAGNEPASAAGASSSSLSPAGVAGIVVGVLALAGAGAAAAVHQGIIQLPSLPPIPGIDVASIAKKLNLQLPAARAQEAPQAPAAPQAGSCDPGAFDAVVPGWPNFTGTRVGYCDGQWATAGAYQTDWREAFHFEGGRWVRVEPAGTSYTGFACYDKARLREQGAPQEVTDRLVGCR